MDGKPGKVVIACTGAAALDIDTIEPLQGNLKTLTVANYEKLKDQIVSWWRVKN